MNAPLTLVDAVHVRIRPGIVKRATKAGPRHLVKWTVNGGDRTRSHDTQVGARAFQADLTRAVTSREKFDPTTGLPESMLVADTGDTVLDLACELVAAEWADWSPGNRRARVEALADLCAVLVDKGRGRPPREVLRRWVRDVELPVDAQKMTPVPVTYGRKEWSVAEQEVAADWLVAHSLPVAALADTNVVKAALKEASVRPDGHPYGADSRQRSRSSLSLLCLLAVEKGLLATNPVKDTKRRVDDDDEAVDPTLVPSPAEARALVAAAAAVSPVADRQYRGYLTTLWTTGMRPSEASGIHHDADLVLPEAGWGRVTLRKPLVHPGKRWTTTGADHHEVRDRLKARKRKAIRVVLLPPETVAALRRHIEVNDVPRGERLFGNSNGNPIDPSSLSKVWRKARARALDGAYCELTTYELRHTAASTMLRAGIPVTRVAKQLGNSPAVVMSKYARVLSGDDEDFMAKLDVALG